MPLSGRGHPLAPRSTTARASSSPAAVLLNQTIGPGVGLASPRSMIHSCEIRSSAAVPRHVLTNHDAAGNHQAIAKYLSDEAECQVSEHSRVRLA